METSILFLIQIMQNGILFTNYHASMPAEFCSWVHLVQNKLHQVIHVISLSLTINYISKRNGCILRLQRNLFSSTLFVFSFDNDDVAKVFWYVYIYIKHQKLINWRNRITWITVLWWNAFLISNAIYGFLCNTYFMVYIVDHSFITIELIRYVSLCWCCVLLWWCCCCCKFPQL